MTLYSQYVIEFEPTENPLEGDVLRKIEIEEPV